MSYSDVCVDLEADPSPGLVKRFLSKSKRAIANMFMAGTTPNRSC